MWLVVCGCVWVLAALVGSTHGRSNPTFLCERRDQVPSASTPLCEVLREELDTTCVIIVSDHQVETQDVVSAALQSCHVKFQLISSNATAEAESGCARIHTELTARRLQADESRWECVSRCGGDGKRSTVLLTGRHSEFSSYGGFQRFRGKKHFTVSTIQYYPLHYRVPLPDGNFTYAGLAVDILNALATFLNFEYSVLEASDSQFGTKLEDGSWSGIVGMVARQEAEIAMSILAITEDRAEAVDFLTPFWVESSSFITRFTADSTLLYYSRPFQLNFWLLTCLTIVIGAAVLTFIEICHKAPSKQRLRSFASELQLFHTFGYMVNQATPKLPEKSSSRLFLSSYWNLAITLVAVYSGNIMAFSTVQKHRLTVNNLEDLAAHPEYQAGLPKGNAVETFFRHARTAQLKTIWENNINVNPANIFTLRDLAKTVERVCTEDFVVMGTETILRLLLSLFKIDGCSLIIAPGYFFMRIFSMAVHKDFPASYKHAFNERLNAMSEAGLITRWLNIHFPCKSDHQGASFGQGYATTEDTAGAYLVLAAGITAACAVLVLETLWKRAAEMKLQLIPLDKYAQKFSLRIWNKPGSGTKYVSR